MIPIRIVTPTLAAVNPARAGMIPRWLPHCPCWGGKPRASGDDPVLKSVKVNGIR